MSTDNELIRRSDLLQDLQNELEWLRNSDEGTFMTAKDVMLLAIEKVRQALAIAPHTGYAVWEYLPPTVTLNGAYRCPHCGMICFNPAIVRAKFCPECGIPIYAQKKEEDNDQSSLG